MLRMNIRIAEFAVLKQQKRVIWQKFKHATAAHFVLYIWPCGLARKARGISLFVFDTVPGFLEL